jgi:cell division septum initiation protein DivIVA
MMKLATLSVTLAGVAQAASVHSATLTTSLAALDARLESSKLSPAQRVVKLLEEMKTQLEAEAKKDAEMFDKLDCWCKTNTAEKEKAVKDGDAKTDELVSVIEENSAKKAKMTATIKQQKKEIAAMRESLAQAEEIRAKEQDAFRAEDTELVKTITNMKLAVQVLSKHNFLQLQHENKSLVQGLQSILHAANEKHLELFGTSGFDANKQSAAAFLQTSTDAATQTGASAVFLQAVAGGFQPRVAAKFGSQIVESFVQTHGPSHLDGYAAQSGQIFGIMTSMLDNFEANLTDGQKAEQEAIAAFQALKATLNAQIDATAKALANAKSEFAEASKTLADAKEELEETRDVRAADVEFLRNLKMQCMDIDHQWEARQKERAAETAAVAEAIGILTSDDNRELLAKTVSFVQVGMSTEERRSRAAAVLREASRRSPSWDDLSFQWQGAKPVINDIKPKQDLAVIAARVQLDAFTKVKQAMDEMTSQIKGQMGEDVKHRDFCTGEFSQNDKNTQKKTHEHEDLSAKSDDLSAQIAALTDDIAKANAAVASAQKEIKKAGEDREAENALFQTEVQEQRATQVVLQKALDKLNQYYAKKAAFLQLKNGAKQTPPVAFTPYNSNAGSSPVLALINKIVEDSKAIETEAMKDEQTAQANYETFVADSNTSIKNLQAEIASNAEAKANKEEDKVNTETSKSDAENELEMLANYKADLHQSCDFVMKNFEVRQQAMTNEIEAIQEAKAILSGAK